MQPPVIARNLVARLLDLEPGSVVGLMGGAGYGKTTVLRQWIEASPGPAAYLQIEPRHREAREFLRDLTSVLRRAMRPADTTDVLPDTAALKADVLHALMSGPLLLTLDAVDILGDGESSKLVAEILATERPRTTIAMTTRASLPDHVANVITRGRFLWFGPTNLEMTASELAPLADNWPDFDAGAWIECTGGWPVTLPLALCHSATPTTLDKTGRTALTRYYLDEVLAHQRPNLRTFVLELSALAPCEVSDLDVLRGSHRSDELVAVLARTPLPLIEIDSSTIIVRSAIAGILQERLRHRHPARWRELTLALASRLAWQGHTTEALALVRQRLDRRAQVAFVLDIGSTLVLRDQAQAVGEWLDDFDSEDMRRYPMLVVLQMIVAAAANDIELVMEWAPFAASSKQAEVQTMAQFVLEVLGRVPTRDLVRHTATHAEAPWNAVAGARLAFDDILAGRLESGVTRLAPLADLLRGLVAIAWWVEDSHLFALSRRGEIEQGVRLVRKYEAERAATRTELQFFDGALAAWFLAKIGSAAEANDAMDQALQGLFGTTRGLTDVRLATCLLLGETAETLGREADLRRALGLAKALRKDVPDAVMLHRELDNLQARLEARGEMLTPAQLRVLEALGTPYPVPTIAKNLFLSPATVRSHIRAIYAKLGVTNRSAAVDKARLLGLL